VYILIEHYLYFKNPTKARSSSLFLCRGDCGGTAEKLALRARQSEKLFIRLNASMLLFFNNLQLALTNVFEVA